MLLYDKSKFEQAVFKLKHENTEYTMDFLTSCIDIIKNKDTTACDFRFVFLMGENLGERILIIKYLKERRQ